MQEIDIALAILEPAKLAHKIRQQIIKLLKYNTAARWLLVWR